MRKLMMTAGLMLCTVWGSQAQAQDPGMEAAQEAQQAAIAAQQEAQRQMEETPPISQQANDPLAQQTTRNLAFCCIFTDKPTFSVKPGTYAAAQKVKIRDKTRGAIIYYTTDGWTPTASSERYKGPITIDSTTKLQAIAIGPGPLFVRSLVADATYTLSGKAAGWTAGGPGEAGAISAGSHMLREGTEVHLVFAQDVSSRTAEVGDKIDLKLADDIKEGGVLLAPKGAAAVGTITQVETTGRVGTPGEVSFEVESLNVNGQNIRLRGSATKEGQAKAPNALFFVPIVGDLSLLRHGKDAEIKAGTPMTAFVDEDTGLPHGRVENRPGG